MSVPTVRRAFGSISKQRTLESVRRVLHFHTFLHLLRIAITLVLLPLDNTIILAAYLAGYLAFLSHSSPIRRRQVALRDVHFYPKTILVSGADTPQGLAVARSWYFQGHRVVGADITELPIPSGESMSKTFVSFYRIPKSQYVPRLLDIIHREKVDVWVPCSERASALEDAMAKQVIESRTHCKCFTLDAELAERFSQPEAFLQYLAEKDLPVVENHQVQSRDSIHKILNRSPSKTYRMCQQNAATRGNKVVMLPKRTLSMTYSEVSEIQISKESPWVLQQQSRLGEFQAELLVACGHVKAISVRPSDSQTTWGQSRLDEGLATAIHKLMERFALKIGPRMTGHLCVQLMVDEEVDSTHVRYAVHIAGCTQGAAAVKHLLQDSSHSLVHGYLTVASPQTNGVLSTDSVDTLRTQAKSIIFTTPPRKIGLYQRVRQCDIRRVLPAFYPMIEQLDRVIGETENHLVFWKNRRFSVHDPLPWWWHAHIYQPLRELEIIMSGKTTKRA